MRTAMIALTLGQTGGILIARAADPGELLWLLIGTLLTLSGGILLGGCAGYDIATKHAMRRAADRGREGQG